MAIAIESTSISDFVSGTDIGSDTEFSITAPTGIQEDELLFVVLQGARSARTVSLPSGFTDQTVPSADSQVVKMGYKYATTADESATEYTFTVAADDNADARWAMYRLSGAQTTGTLAVNTDGFTDLADGTSTSEAADLTTLTGGFLVTLISSVEIGASDASGFSSLVLTGATVTNTERFDSKGTPASGSATYGALYDGIPGADGDITNVSFNYTDDTEDNDTLRVSMVFIRPQQSDSTTLTLTETAQSTFAVEGSAGNVAVLNLTTTNLVAFTPTVLGTSPTVWTHTTKPGPAWTNKNK